MTTRTHYVFALVGVGQVGTGGVASDADVVERVRLRKHASLDIPQTLPVGKLSEDHAEKLISTEECRSIEVALVLADQAPERVPWRQIHQLSEHQLSRAHRLPSDKFGRLRLVRRLSSSQ